MWLTTIDCALKRRLHGHSATTHSLSPRWLRFVHVLLCERWVLIVKQCPSAHCTLYAVDGTCTSVCAACGVLCEAFPIRDLVSLSLYKKQGCNIISGDLFIIELPANVAKVTLFDHLKTVRVIQGHLYIMHNDFLTAMTFLSNLERVDGITYLDNSLLVDAHLHGLESYTIPFVVEGCPRLCPARYTDKTYSGMDESECADTGAKFFLHVVGNASVEAIDLLGAVMARVVRNTTQGEVWLDVCVDLLYSLLWTVGWKCYCVSD